MKLLTYLLTSFLFLFSATTFPQNFTSDTKETHLIELYTSEGCSSCPPADKWVSKLKTHPDLWSKFIPIAFHVDYWDYIGWKDPFAQPQFSIRQRQHNQLQNISSVYTPGMLLNSQEWTAWQKQSRLSLPTNKTTNNKLSVDLNNGEITALFHTNKQSLGLRLNVALLGFNVESKIESGENSGHTFSHDFVVLAFQRITMQELENGSYTGSLTQLPSLSQESEMLAISVWVDGKDLVPLQATGGWIKQPTLSR